MIEKRKKRTHELKNVSIFEEKRKTKKTEKRPLLLSDLKSILTPIL